MYSGNTILGDGSVILIIDPNGGITGDRLVGGLDHWRLKPMPSRAAHDGERHGVAPGVPLRLAGAEGSAAVARHAP